MSRVAALFLSAAVVLVPAVAGNSPALAAPIVLANNSTPGYYNEDLGTLLDGTQPQFPCANGICGDPTINPAPEPDLSAAAAILGDWLSDDPLPLNSHWSGPQAIPLSWPVNTETAIVYTIDGGTGGLRDVTVSLGVDNGVFMWVNGDYVFGALGPGLVVPGEYVVNLGDLPPGLTYIQILREDHGAAIGYHIQITGEPNTAPDCSGVVPSSTVLWPPDHSLRTVALTGATDPDGDPVTLTIAGTTQDEPVNETGDGNTAPDAELGAASDEVLLRAERSGTGDGRVYRVAFTATDDLGASCSGTVTVTVPHDRGKQGAAVDSGGSYSSLEE